ncbi:Arylsulfatase A [Cyclobacterium lianum]|uniref:Arylsulfatase A n=2 Tax=Cyclobacterium lianum TaxID=388280 RepID=A0A1M7NJK8_9BACT|nr:Arylsulfatase A [Cyclobacterium lianum]
MNSRLLLSSLMLGILTFFGCESREAKNEKPNVLFIAVDDLRPELGCYGVDYVHTPNIDKLASEGRIFFNHFVHAAACGPSRSTLLSGTRTTDWDIFKTIRESGSKPTGIFSLPQLFKENGYRTVGIGKISHQPGGVMDSLQTQHEVPFSWDVSFAPVGEWREPWSAFFSYAGGKARTSYYGRPTNRSLPPFEAAEVDDEGYADGHNAAAAIRQLRQLRDSTFFLAVGFYKPHLPFNAPRRYWDLYDPESIPASDYQQMPENVSSDLSLHYGRDSYEPRGTYTWPGDTLGWEITPEREKILKHGYLAAVSYVDAQIGKVLDELTRLGLDENTIVVLWGDHGWHLGDYGIWGKHTNFDIALNSPLIVRQPGMTQPGVAAHGLVETVDIFPTLADLCRIPAPMQLEGKSFKSAMENPEAPLKDYVLGERDAWGVLGKTVRTRDYRLMVWIDKSSGDTLEINLFDNREQPLPHQNIREDQPQLVTDLKKKLEAIEQERTDFFSVL